MFACIASWSSKILTKSNAKGIQRSLIFFAAEGTPAVTGTTETPGLTATSKCFTSFDWSVVFSFQQKKKWKKIMTPNLHSVPINRKWIQAELLISVFAQQYVSTKT